MFDLFLYILLIFSISIIAQETLFGKLFRGLIETHEIRKSPLQFIRTSQIF